MECKICIKPIIDKDDIHWLDDVIVCSDCYEKNTEDYYKTPDEWEME